MRAVVPVSPGAVAASLVAAARWPSLRPALADWIAAERGRFFPWLPVAMTAGNALYFSLLHEPPIWLGAATLVPAALAALATRHRVVVRALCLALAAASLG